MCRKLALAATALVAIAAGLPALAADPAKPAATSTPKAPAPAKPVKATKAERDMAERLPPLARASFWSDQVHLDPNDAEAGLKFAAALRTMNEWDKAAEAAEDVTVRHPDNEDAFLDLGRAHLGAGDGFYAIVPLKRAQALNPRDWRPLTLLAVAYEQTGRDEEAQATHLLAQQAAPNNPAVLANLAMFRLGQGKAAEAETLLRRAVTLPGAAQQQRQDLAYVLGRQGRLEEAEKLMRQDLPPEAVDNNMAYLKASLQKAEATPHVAVPAAAAPTATQPARTYDALRSDAG